MADLLCEPPELRPFVLLNVRFTGTRIGAGAYGSVEEVEIPGAICAAKKIHEIYQDRSRIQEADINKASTQFVKECQLLSTLRHPHIVQFLGVCFLPGWRLPALVMELLLTSLHELLDPDVGVAEAPPDTRKPFLPLGLKQSVLHDVARGLTYLHDRSPPIIHRDLSAKNVLLNSAMVAKIADLGMARIVPYLGAATMTKAPGTAIYMPPEAVVSSTFEIERSVYSASIDIFSLGVVSIFTLSQTFPCHLLGPNYTDEESGFLKARTELERRDEYMQKIYSQLRKDHPLIEMIERCLHNVPARRPDIRDVLRLLEQARAEIRDDESDMNRLQLIQALQSQPRIQSLERDLQTRVRENADLQQQVQTVAQQNQNLEEQAQEQLRQLNESSKREIEDLQQQIQNLKQQIQNQTPSAALPSPQPRTLATRDTSHPTQLVQPRQLRPRPTPPERAGPSSLPSTQRKLTVQCHLQKEAPSGMFRGSAVADQDTTYCAWCDIVYRYTMTKDKWEQLPQCPLSNSGLVVVDSALTAVGGYEMEGSEGCRPTNKLVTLQQNRWVVEYPPMNMARYNTAVVSTSDGEGEHMNVIAIGGEDSGGSIDTVEILHTGRRSWSHLNSLPRPLVKPSATICGNQVHVIGNNDDYPCSSDGYSCSMQDLQSSNQPTWTPLPRLPVADSTAATLCGQLVIVGGRQSDMSLVNSIHQLVDEQWINIGSISCGRWWCLVACPSPHKMVVVGGGGAVCTVEVCFAV